MKPLNLNLNEIGHDMLKMVQKAIAIIRRESHDIQVEFKTALNGGEVDFATNGDKRAQEMYLAEIARLYPDFGIIAEEGNLAKPCAINGHNVFFTIDPLDGTKAYKRQQAYGVGTMIALICDGKVIAVTIGDANTEELYHYAGDAVEGNVMMKRFGRFTNLAPDTTRPLRGQYVQLREMPRKQPAIVNDMILHPEEGGLFKDADVGGGSIGLVFARLWKGEVGATIIAPGKKTPWDMNPIIGICNRLGFLFYTIDHNTGQVVRCQYGPIETIEDQQYSMLVIHKTRAAELKQWLANN